MRRFRPPDLLIFLITIVIGLSIVIIFLPRLLEMSHSDLSANPSKGLGIYLHPELSEYGPFSHVCQMNNGERYYAVLGAKNGTIFVDYTDNVLEERDIQFFPGAPSKWRECRSYTYPNGYTYAYVVTEGPDFSEYPGGIQIFKMGDAIELVNTYIDKFNSAHTIFIDQERGLAFVNGSGWKGDKPEHYHGHNIHLRGFRILDIKTDPSNPIDLGSFNDAYVHDSYALGEVEIPPQWKFDEIAGEYVKEAEPSRAYIVYLANIYKGYIHVLNVIDPANPILENSVFTPLYNQGISTHNVWASEDKQWLFATEETWGSSLLVYDISNPVKPRFVTAYRSENVSNESMIHNVVIKDNIAYCTWYQEGLRVIDVSNPNQPKEIGFFDSSPLEPDKNDPFHGNWSVDVDGRGLIMISDIEEGLFILKKIPQ